MLTKFNQHILLRLTFYSYKCIIPTNTDTICRVLNIIAFAQEGHESARENHYYFKEKAMRNPNSLVYKTRRYGLFRFLLDLEYKAFGYRRAGGTTETVDDGYEVTSTDTNINVNHKTHIVRYAHYMRHYKYPTTFLNTRHPQQSDNHCGACLLYRRSSRYSLYLRRSLRAQHIDHAPWFYNPQGFPS